MKKAYIRLVPLLALAIVISLTILTFASQKRTSSLEKILSENVKKQTIKVNNNSSGNVRIRTNSQTNNLDTKSQTNVQTDKYKVEMKEENGKITTKIINENGEEIHLESAQEKELKEKTEIRLKDNDLQISTSQHIAIIHNGILVESTFPVTVNPQTGQLQISTPLGEKEVAILPAQAVQKLAEKQIEATEKIQLIHNGKELVYDVKGLKKTKIFGLFPSTTRLQAEVSVQTGKITKTKQNPFDKIITAFSL